MITPPFHFGLRLQRGAVVAAMVAMAAPLAFAQAKRQNPGSKVYVSDVNGEAQIDTGDSIQDLSKKSVYSAQGTVIETKNPDNPADRGKNYSTMVYSNGTGAYFDADTRVELKKFSQEPFTPNRTDVDVEPSISQTQAYLARGTVGLCTSKQVAGSSMNYETPFGSVNIHGTKVVIDTNNNGTVISMLEGESTVRAGALDTGGHTIHAGEQAVIRPGAPGTPNLINIQPIPPSTTGDLDNKVSMACLAKKTVYFEVKERAQTPAEAAAAAAAGKANPAKAAAEDSADGPIAGGPITAFDAPPANAKSTTTVREIVAVPVVPVNLPVEYSVSPASLTSGRPGG